MMCRSISRTFAAFAFLLLTSLAPRVGAQELKSGNPLIDSAFRLAVWTIDHNTHDGLIHAGGGYGGEWTRDCAINSWNAVSLLRPEVAEKSLWSVTDDSLRIGHQYWDKIIWTLAAHHHFLVTGDTLFLRKAYDCAAATMRELEAQCFDSAYGLFMGPAVFQDGIAGYDEPVYDPAKWDDSYVLHHPNSATIKCLSTNAVYYQAYRCLYDMASLLKEPRSHAAEYLRRAAFLQNQILLHLYRSDQHRPYYLIDHTGRPHDYQEGLGLAFTLLFDLLPQHEAADMVAQAYTTPHGLPCVYPSFPRNTYERPGRHNFMIWPHVNMLYASGCARQGLWEPFYFELENLADLAVNRGQGDFYEIYTVEGEPSGGWQCGGLWDKKEHQTWCATGYLRLILDHIFGITLTPQGLELHPHGMADGSQATLTGIPYRGTTLTITLRGHGPQIKSCLLNHHLSAPQIPPTAQAPITLEIVLGE